MPTDFNNPISSFLADKSMSVPLGQVLLFAFMLTLCLLFGRHKLGLMVSYAFVFYWGFIFNRSYFIDLLGNTSSGLYTYGIFGFLMAVLAIVGMFKKVEGVYRERANNNNFVRAEDCFFWGAIRFINCL